MSYNTIPAKLLCNFAFRKVLGGAEPSFKKVLRKDMQEFETEFETRMMDTSYTEADSVVAV